MPRRSREPEPEPEFEEEEEEYLSAEEGSPWIEALGDHVILEECDPGENRTPSGLVIPANVSLPKGSYKRFRVIAVGPLCSDDRLSEFPEPSLRVGEIVLAPVDELGTYRDGKNLYYIAHYELLAAVMRE
jgi:co-chaperonin GroES (HSP10)